MRLARRARIAAYQARFAAMVPVALPRLFARLYEAPFYSGMHNAWLDTLSVPTGSSAADVGCGPGGLTFAIADRGLQTTGFDRSERMLEAARLRSPSEQPAPSFVCADATALPLADQSVDLVVCSSLLNVVDEPVVVLRELRRVAKSGGTVSALLPDPALKAVAATRYGESAELSAADAALLQLWARAAPKVAPAQATEWFADAGMTAVECSVGLSGLVYMLTASTSSDQGP